MKTILNPEDIDPDDNGENFGPCCACGCTNRSGRYHFKELFFEYPKDLPRPATVWGDPSREIPMNYATAVLCDRCVLDDKQPSQFIVGYASDNQRGSIATLLEKQWHHN